MIFKISLEILTGKEMENAQWVKCHASIKKKLSRLCMPVAPVWAGGGSKFPEFAGSQAGSVRDLLSKSKVDIN